MNEAASAISNDDSSSEVVNTVQYDGFDQEASNRVKDLARTLSRASSLRASDADSDTFSIYSFKNVQGTNPILAAADDPKLDPNSDEFDSKLWVMNLQKMINSDPGFYKPTQLGVSFKNLRASGASVDSDYQANFLNSLPKDILFLFNKLRNKKPPSFDILKPMDGLLKPGEVCVVLGKPGAGCTTFLKTIATQTYGFSVDPESQLAYDGLTSREINRHYRGEVVYCAETENHFPNLSVGDTLKFAASLRVPDNRASGLSREEYAQHMTDVIMATYGLSHTRNTRVGNDYIRGVSGGERKRVSICEVALSGAKVQCWDNSTRGLDSATALEFIKALKTSAVISKTTPIVAIYQCSQIAYDLFDTVQLLYDGYQIFFGDAKKAKDYFLEMGYECPPRQTTADYLTSITSPSERKAKPGFENKVPRSPKEFYDYWMNSKEHSDLLKKIDEYNAENSDPESINSFKEAHVARQSRGQRPASPYTVNFRMQVAAVVKRNFLRIRGDPSITIFTVVMQVVMALIISSIFFNLQSNTNSFYYRTAALFFALLFNSFGSLLEIFSLYEARPIVEKHKTYALYHPSADAVASIISELPSKVFICLAFNLTYYFMVNLRRTPGHFFFYLLVNFTSSLAMSHLFRTLGAATSSLSESMTPAAILLISLSIFTGFVIPVPDMHGWCKWITYLNPLSYSFEALMANEFHNKDYACSVFVPSGSGYPSSGDNVICTTVGSVQGQSFVNGDAYINKSFKYYWNHRWRDWGIIVAFVVFFLFVYITLCEYNKGAMQKGEILLFQRSAMRKLKKQKIANSDDLEAGVIEEKIAAEQYSGNEKESNSSNGEISKEGNIFHWRHLTYQVKIKSEDRIILNEVSGFVKPGTVTALMGASGAGKTTLLNALSARLTSGVVTNGTRMVNGRPLDKSFQRSIGYVQQQDLHLETSTVREALIFSAELRQPASVPRKEKLDYVENIIGLLEMEKYADAVVGVAGEGLNVEQRKRLTIGVELVAKPELLVFLDEPTSGLDSQTAWSICKLIRKLADNGQAILCTIHQPSAILMQQFDRLLFLQRGGETVYFGELGKDCQNMINYFEKYGAPKCPPEANPAEWMLEVIGAAPGSHANQDYFEVWRNSAEYQDLQKELDIMETELPTKIPVDDNPEKFKSYAASTWKQYCLVTKRTFEQAWRSPKYLYSKFLLSIFTSMFIGFIFFKAKKTIMGMTSQMFAIFMFLMPFNCLVQQYLPNYVAQRGLYEVRERPSRTFNWFAFITSQITSEIPWQILCGTIAFFCFYYPVGFYQNAKYAGNLHGRGAMLWVQSTLFYIYCITMAQFCISFQEIAENAANMASMLFTLCLLFCGALAGPVALPGFWIFMYRCSPFNYFIAATLAAGIADNKITCAETEYLSFPPPANMTCGSYMSTYINKTGGYLLESTIDSTANCRFCPLSETNVFLKSVSIDPTKIGQNTGIFFAFIAVNIIGTIFLYWLGRVPKGNNKRSA